MSVQFDTFDTIEDRRELVVLFQKLGEGAPHPEAVRARWIEGLIPQSLSSMSAVPMRVNPASCHPVGAYMIFVQVVGVLGVPIRDAARQLDEYVRGRMWFQKK